MEEVHKLNGTKCHTALFPNLWYLYLHDTWKVNKWYIYNRTLWNFNITYYNHDSLYRWQQCPLIYNLYTLHCFLSSTVLCLLVKSLYKYICTKHVQKSVLEMLEWKTTAIKGMECWPEHLHKFKVLLSLNTQNQLNMHPQLEGCWWNETNRSPQKCPERNQSQC